MQNAGSDSRSFAKTTGRLGCSGCSLVSHTLVSTTTRDGCEMIAWLEGIIKKTMADKSQDVVILDVNGVGYQVFVSRRVLEHLPVPGNSVALEIHTHVREDAIHLFGFSDPREREVFQALISMSGIGPKAAMGVLSGIDPAELIQAICSGDLVRLCAIPGIGKKKAERMVMDLKEKLSAMAPATTRAVARCRHYSARKGLDDMKTATAILAMTVLVCVGAACEQKKIAPASQPAAATEAGPPVSMEMATGIPSFPGVAVRAPLRPRVRGRSAGIRSFRQHESGLTAGGADSITICDLTYRLHRPNPSLDDMSRFSPQRCERILQGSVPGTR